MNAEARARWKGRLLEAAPALLAGWAGFALLHAVLSALAPRGVLTDVRLPAYAKALLLCTEWTALAVVGLLLAPLFGGLVFAERRMPSRGRWPWRAARDLLAGLLLLAYVATWAAFWIGGRFLDGRGLGFYFGNAAIMLGYALEMHPTALRVLPVLALATGAAAAELLPRLLRRLTPRGRSAATGALATAIALCALTTVAGEAVRWGGTSPVQDPETGVSFALGEYYEMRRDFRAGPLIHAFLASDKERALRDDPLFASAPAEEIRRPLVTPQAHVAGLDPARLHRWNVVVVLVDSLRTDQLRAYGGARDVMPILDGVAREGRVYLDHHSNGTMTDIASPCPNTSHYPLRKRTLGELKDIAGYPRVLIYDLLKALGYRTAFVASNNEFWGGTIHLLWSPSLDLFYTAGGRIPPGGPEAMHGSPRQPAVDDAQTVDEALAWLKASGDAPFYLYLNLQNGHAPYRTPDSHPRPFGRKPDYTISAGFFPIDKIVDVKDVYADSLNYVDAQLGRLIAHLKSTGDWDRTVFVLSADHGEAFHEHGFGGHGARPYDEIARVPLIVRAPGLAPGPDRTPAELIDIAPTVCGLLGVPPHPSFQGVDLASPAAKVRSRFLVSQTILVRDYGVLVGRHKLIYDADGGRYLLFDREADPEERRDVAKEHPQVVRDLAGRLHAWRKAQITYYEDRSRWTSEYPPGLRER
jgi:arylsulfatase A-like enzyme